MSNQRNTSETRKPFAFNVDTDFLRMSIITVIIFVAMALLSKKFTTAKNIEMMGFQIPELGFYSLAMMMVMITGGRDLSVVGIGNFAGIIAAMIMHQGNLNAESTGSNPLFSVILGVAAALAIGVLCGAMNGFLIARFSIAPMLLTLATNYIFTGLSIAITNAEAVSQIPEGFTYLGTHSFLGVPIPLLLLILAVLFAGYLLNFSKFGFEVKMIGSNARASYYSGMNNNRILLKTYIYSGIMSALAGIIILMRTSTAKADYAADYTFQAILCAVLGATAPDGGFAKITCMVLSLASLQFLASGFSLLRLGGFFKQFAWGALLVIVLSMNFFMNLIRKNRSLRKIRNAEGASVKG